MILHAFSKGYKIQNIHYTRIKTKYYTISGNFVQGYIVFVGHVPQEGEDHKAGEETGQRIDGAGDDGISELRKKKEAEIVQNENV